VSMKPIYSRDGLRRLDQVVQPGLLCAFDFDGTLAPIVDDPAQASLSPQMLRRLVALADHATVAIISGRSVPDLRQRLRLEPALAFEPAHLVGNHGIEDDDRADRARAGFEALCRDWQDALEAAVRRRRLGGVRIENKRYSLSLHYRAAWDRAAAERDLLALCARLDPAPRVVSGKCVVNLLPPDAPDKGAALERLMQASAARSVIYIGDDVTDEDVFKLTRPNLLSIRIEPAAGSAASFYLPQQPDVVSLLEEIVRRLDAGRS
jgi:trehalose 6-phosphate phosphatase